MKLNSDDIEAYKRMASVPAGAILGHILKRLQLSQAFLSTVSGIRPQHIYALIKGSRRFSPSSSISIENALNIDEKGFFFCHQSLNDVYKCIHRDLPMPDLSKLKPSTFWDVDLKYVQWQNSASWAIRRVLEYGNIAEVKELVGFYGEDKCKQAIERMQFRNPTRAIAVAKEAGLI